MYGRFPQKTTSLSSRRRFLKLGAAAAGCGVGGHFFFVAPYSFILLRQDVPIPNLPPALDGLRVGVLSDPHLGAFMSGAHLQAGVDALHALSPDIILLAGDYAETPEGLDECMAVLDGLRAPLGAFGVLGNHEMRLGGNWAMPKTSVRILENETVAVQHNGARLHVLGLGDAMWNRADPVHALAATAPRAGEPTLVLVHEPDYADTISDMLAAGAFKPNTWMPLQISGHSHGGQVQVPGVGPLYLPPLAQKYYQGLYRLPQSDRLVFTSVGFGSLLSLRVHCPPEICLLTLRAGNGPAMASLPPPTKEPA